MRFLSFSELQGKVNSAYYKAKGKAIYRDFGTFSSRCNKLSLANARDFSSFCAGRKDLPGKIEVAEFGVGNGNFAYSFLKSLDETEPELLSRIRYTLCDFSDKMLDDALGKLKKYEDIVAAKVVDASKGTGSVKAHYIRSNELLTDLPAKIYVMRNGALLEVLFALKGKEVERHYVLPVEHEKGAEMALRMLKRLPEGYELSFNFAAAEFLKSLRHALHPGGYADIFDYGFISAEEITEIPEGHWNANTVREYGGQLTTDANFVFLSAICRSAGMETELEKQKDYAERAIGQELYRFDLGGELFYFTKQEAVDRKKELLKQGYEEEEIASILGNEVSDSDDFVHMRIRN
jgi:SAM-dependent MidA family methyltransferase